MVLTSEATADGVNGRCNEAPHPAFLVDITVENSMTAPPGTRVEHDPYQGPMVLSTMWVDPRFGERYPRGNYCTRGARFGVHSSEENFNNPLYGKLTVLAYFNGGMRVWDIREPYNPAASRVLRYGSQCQHGPGGLHDQQRRDRQSRLHLHRRPQRRGHGYPATVRMPGADLDHSRCSPAPRSNNDAASKAARLWDAESGDSPRR